jgi:hypothetical protein
MSKCKNCHCDCHCKESLHGHHYDGDLCTCEGCQCGPQGLVVDDTDECLGCS